MKVLYLDCAGGVTAWALANGLFALAGDAGTMAERLCLRGFSGFRWSEESGIDLSGAMLREDLAARSREVLKKAGCEEALLAWAALCLALGAELGVGRVIASPVNLGVPLSPVAAGILRGKPVMSSADAHTSALGAAILTELTDEFGALSAIELLDCAAGSGDGACVRAMIGETEEARPAIVELSASIDDMTPEELGFAQERFFAAGALEVYSIALNMKKSRPGVLLCVMCEEERKEDMLKEIFRHTTTLGVRANYSQRYALKRRTIAVETPLGAVRRKIAQGYGVKRGKWEYDDLARLARETGRGIGQTRALLDAAINAERSEL